MRVRIEIDFNLIEPEHEEVDKRLTNWARWLHGGGGGGVAPMFKWYRPDNYGREYNGVAVDGTDAQRIHKGVQALPDKHRVSVMWNYVTPRNPRRTCQIIGTSLEGLALLVRDSRQMLINRKV